MSLKFFFNRRGAVVWGLLVSGWVFLILNLLKIETQSPTSHFFLWLLVGQAFLITSTRFFPWYAKADRGYGIEEHFEKTMVPLAYILSLGGIVFWAVPNWGILVFSNVLLIPIWVVNFILIHFHYRDHDQTPPSFFVRQ